jgi:hypothetical protein
MSSTGPKIDFYFFDCMDGMRLSPLGTHKTPLGPLYQVRVIHDYGLVGGMTIGRGNRRTRRKPAPVLFSPPQIPYDLIWHQTRGCRGGKSANNRLSYVTVTVNIFVD